MSNRSHFNPAHRAMNMLRKKGLKHSSAVDFEIPDKTFHGVFIEDAVEFLKKLPPSSIQLVLIDPPYNLGMAYWDNFEDYINWAKNWLDQIERVLSDNGNFVIFDGFQYQDVRKGDLLEIMHYLRHNSNLRFVNLIEWCYKTGMSAHRFFANRHEEILWFSKTKKYYFDLDAVRIPFDEKTQKIYMRDKRLNPESIKKGKNPTNVWGIERLVGNSSERVGHPTQKPLKAITRLVEGLSYPGSVVLDFFAGSGTTGRVCIERKRHSILVDNDKETISYFKKHLEKMEHSGTEENYEILYNIDIRKLLEKFKNNA